MEAIIGDEYFNNIDFYNANKDKIIFLRYSSNIKDFSILNLNYLIEFDINILMLEIDYLDKCFTY